MRLHRTLYLLPLSVLTLFLTSLVHADFQAGKDAYDRGNYEIALQEWRLAAKQGDDDAQFYLGVSYNRGRGVVQDNTQAVRWWRLAAEQGNAKAQYSLGNMYYQGDGVPQNDTQAVKWWRLAAEQGNVKAQYDLGYMYYQGLGISQDYIQAHMWFSLAEKLGHKNTVVFIYKVEKKLTVDQIAEAQRLACEWQPKITNRTD